MSDALPASLVQSWTTKIVTWENDRSAPNPYYTTVISMWAYNLGRHILTLDLRDF